MNIESIREYCLKKKGVEESYPFDETTLVFKVMGKMFLLAALEKIPLQINLKADPEKAIEQRERYEAILPGYHQSKKHWNTIVLDGSIPDNYIKELINDSYFLVAEGFKKSDRLKLDRIK